jgi:outer membrane protein assembly factor BamB
MVVILARKSQHLFGLREDCLMFRRLVPVWVIVSAIGCSVSARAQSPFPVDLLPTRTSLERLGLERHWYGVVPLVETERVIRISLSGAIVFAQTDYAMVYAFDAESGRLLWSTQLGERTGFARGVATNSFGAYVSNANNFFALDKATGRLVWRMALTTIPTCSPACDENLAMVGLTSGLLIAVRLKQKDAAGKETITSSPHEAWRLHADGPILTRPLPAEQMVAFASVGGKVYVVGENNGAALFRFSTGGPIGEGVAGYGTRTLLIPSGDNILYGVDLFTAQATWSFPSGAPIEQEPIVADEDIFIANTVGNLSSIRPSDGVPRWTTGTHGGRTQAVGAHKIYLRSYDRDLFVIDRSTGRVLVDPGDSYLRAGVNLREYNLDIVNRFNDRIYLATGSGLVLCLREASQPHPRPLRDPKALPFGYVPAEGIKPTPPAAPSAEPGSQAKPEESGQRKGDAEPPPKGQDGE